MNASPVDHWRQHARQWSFVRPPLRPCAEDIAFTQSAVDRWLAKTRRADPTLLVLGVTRELCGLSVGANARVIAVDRSADMIRALWPGPIRARDEVHCSDWRNMPVPEASVDVVLADGSLSALPFPDGYSDLCAELRRVLRPGGLFVVRCFAQIDERESLEAVFADLAGRRIGNFHLLKWRIAMAIQPGAAAGVAVGSVWDVLNAAWPDLDALADHCGWPREEVRTIDAYRGVETRYTFPTLAEYLRFFPGAGFAVVNVATPGYELGSRFPTLVFERSDSPLKA